MSGRLSSYKNLQKRLDVQEKMCAKASIKGSGFENLSFLHGLLRKGLKVFGLEERGLRNIIDFRLVENDLSVSGLDPFWEGKRILHLSDTHLDGIPGLLEKLQEEFPKLKYDLCFYTGDFRFGKAAFHPAQLAPTLQLLDVIDAPLGVYGILGNHDFIEQVEPLEEKGMRVLLNESVDLGNNLYLAGVDDPHLYMCEDLDEAFIDIPEESASILLVHSPECVEEAVKKKADIYLCGHTHGGQIGLPIIGKPFTNARSKRKYSSGHFEYGGMQGYTHNGTGASSVPARFNCPSEVVIHTLKRK